jgi:hypothetical protein
MCHLKIMKYHAFQVNVVVEHFENSDVRWNLHLCVSVIFVVSLAALQVRLPLCSGYLLMSLYYTHETETLGCN